MMVGPDGRSWLSARSVRNLGSPPFVRQSWVPRPLRRVGVIGFSLALVVDVNVAMNTTNVERTRVGVRIVGKRLIQIIKGNLSWICSLDYF